MDILAANFPDKVLRKDPLTEALKQFPSDPFIGNRGRTSSEAGSVAGVICCDDTFLNSLLGHMEHLELLIFAWALQVPQAWDYRISAVSILLRVPEEEGGEMGDPEREEHDDYLRHAIADLEKATKQMARLFSKPELFPDKSTAKRFAVSADKKLKTAEDLFAIHNELQDCREEVQKGLDCCRGSHPINPETGEECHPWTTFLGSLPMNSNYALLNPVKIDNPGMDIGRNAQCVPVPGILIAEHWRQKLAGLITKIAAKSSDPSVVASLYPPKTSLEHQNHHIDGKSAVALISIDGGPRDTEENRKKYAFGPQSKVADAASLLAMLEGQVTNRESRANVVQMSLCTKEVREEILNNEEEADVLEGGEDFMGPK